MSDNTKFNKTEVSRVGRENQVYNETTGARLVAGCVCLNQETDLVLMVQSTAHKKKWVLPKGGVERDEYPDFSKTATRETWEEAGCLGNIVRDLGIVHDMRPPKQWGKIAEFNKRNPENIPPPPRSEFHFFEMIVTELAETYPESDSRTRKWFSYLDCISELERAKRPELIECVKRSNITKN